MKRKQPSDWYLGINLRLQLKSVQQMKNELFLIFANFFFIHVLLLKKSDSYCITVCGENVALSVFSISGITLL